MFGVSRLGFAGRKELFGISRLGFAGGKELFGISKRGFAGGKELFSFAKPCNPLLWIGSFAPNSDDGFSTSGRILTQGVTGAFPSAEALPSITGLGTSFFSGTL